MNNSYIKMSIAINLLIIILNLVATIVMFTAFKFMSGGLAFGISNLEMFKFFIVDSNIFMGIISLLFLIEEIKVLNGKTKSISKFMYTLKLVATVD